MYIIIYIYAFFILLFWSYLQEAAGVAFHFLSIALSTSFCDVQNNNTYKIHKRIMTIWWCPYTKEEKASDADRRSGIQSTVTQAQCANALGYMNKA